MSDKILCTQPLYRLYPAAALTYSMLTTYASLYLSISCIPVFHTCHCLCVMPWASVYLSNTSITCYFYKWLLPAIGYLIPPSDMHQCGMAVVGCYTHKCKFSTINQNALQLLASHKVKLP